VYSTHYSYQACARLQHYNIDAESAIHVELVDSVIGGLKRGRAAGPDGVSAEHLHFSHPIICVLLSILVKLILKYIRMFPMHLVLHDYSTAERG